MKNGERLTRMCLFEMLMMFRKNAHVCVRYLLTGDVEKRERICKKYGQRCEDCLQDWLNEEERK